MDVNSVHNKKANVAKKPSESYAKESRLSVDAARKGVSIFFHFARTF